jgi:hypothetical protein
MGRDTEQGQGGVLVIVELVPVGCRPVRVVGLDLGFDLGAKVGDLVCVAPIEVLARLV